MMIERMGTSALDFPPRAEGRYGKGERFSVEKSGGSSEEPGATEGTNHRAERAGTRRRPAVRYAKRAGETHGLREHAHEEEFKIEETEFHLDFGEEVKDPGQGDSQGTGEGGSGGGSDDQAAAADFEELTAHLLGLQGEIREVTLLLPALGRVTARSENGAITIVVDVPQHLLAAVRRGGEEMRERMNQKGLFVTRILVRSHDEEAAAESPEPAQKRSARGLVDVMA
jgi:hypothetical protein